MALYIFCISVCMLSLLPVKDRERYHAVGIFMFIVLIVVMANADESMVDLRNYSITYNSINSYVASSFTDQGYYFIQLVLKKLGFNFYQFRITIFSICFCLFYFTIVKFTNQVCFFVLFYALFYSIMDAEQLRNFVSYSIVFYSLPFLMERNKSGNIKYLIGVVIASLFHFAGISYLVFLVINTTEKYRKRLIYFVPVYLVVMFVVSRSSGAIQSAMRLVGSLGNEGVNFRINNYALTRSRTAFILPSGIYLINTLAIYLLSRSVSDGSFIEYCPVKATALNEIGTETFVNSVLAINLLGCLFIPLCMVNLTFYRLLRNICVFNIVCFAQQYELIPKSKRKLYIVLCCFATTLLWQIWDFTIYQDWSSMMKYFFHV